MIEIKDLTFSDVGRLVVFQGPLSRIEQGILTSWNDMFVFVKFRGPNGEACKPEYVEFVFDQCDHELEVCNESFDHEYGCEQIWIERCFKCDEERPHEPQQFDDDVI
jgi:hypothetical protein